MRFYKEINKTFKYILLETNFTIFISTEFTQSAFKISNNDFLFFLHTDVFVNIILINAINVFNLCVQMFYAFFFIIVVVAICMYVRYKMILLRMHIAHKFIKIYDFFYARSSSSVAIAIAATAACAKHNQST